MAENISKRLVFTFLISAGVASAEQIALVPDTQAYTQNTAHHPLLLSQTSWIADNSETENLALISHVGDIVSFGGSVEPDDQWRFADQAFSALDGSVPMSFVYGNHDFDVFSDSSGGSTRAQSWFGASRYEKYDWFGGSSPDGENFYQYFNIGDQRLLHVGIKFAPDEVTLSWAANLIRGINLPTVLTTHAYLTDAGMSRRGNRVISAGRDRFGEFIWERLVRSTDQIFMVLGGHNHAGENVTVSGEYSEDGEYHQVSRNDAGREVWELLANYQDYPNGGDGWLQLIDLDPEAGRISVRTYSPFLEKYQEDAMSRYELQADLRSRWKLSN